VHGHSNAEPILPPSGEGTVVLDIGGDTGAAVIYTDSALSGSEIEIKPQGQSWKGVHTGVRQRDLPGEVCFAAVFGSIPAGSYDLRVKGTNSEPVMIVEIVGGGVAEAQWPSVAPTMVVVAATVPGFPGTAN
jgi:hypothetical protein